MNTAELLAKYAHYTDEELSILSLATFYMYKVLPLPGCVLAASRASKELRKMCRPDLSQRTRREAAKPARAYRIGWHDHSIRRLT